MSPKSQARHACIVAAMLAIPLCVTAGDAAANPQGAVACAEDSRDCLLVAAKSYLHAVVTHDGSKALLDPDVRRTVQGGWPLVGEDALRKSLDMEPDMLPDRDTRFFVDETQRTVVVFTLLPVQGTNADPQRQSHDTGGKAATIHLVQRLKVEKGLVTEIEVIFHQESGTTDGTSGW